MNNNVLLSLALSIIPLLAIIFVILLVIYKVYIKIRSRFNVTVNCWFCNQNTKVPYLEANSWTCPSCEQYNGFDKDGDYNREIYEQLDCSRNSERFNVSQPPAGLQQPAQNGFCEVCNEAQRLKMEKLAQFEPKNESHWNEELKIYKAQLEDQYRLCSTCDRHLNKVLREKKKMVLGSKFLDFIIKGAETLKQPHLNQIQHAQQQLRKQKLRIFIILLTVINLICLLPGTLSKKHFTLVLGESLGHSVFIIASHVIALAKVMGSYLNVIKQHALVIKISLFSRTLFMMIMYSMGLKVNHFDFYSLYINFCPFAVLALAFMHNIVDGFRLTRFTGMIAIWSLFAGGLLEDTWLNMPPQMLLLFTSFMTFLMAYTSKTEFSPKLHDTANSFHKIYSEDYLSDEETMSMLSQQLNGSCVSMRSVRSNKSFRAPSPLIRANVSPRLTKSLTSSAYSLHQLPRNQISPNSSFRTYAGEENQTLRDTFATPMTMPLSGRQGLFVSNLELNSREQPQSTIFGMNSSVANSTMLNSSFTETNKTRFANSTHDNEASFYSAANNTGNTSMFSNNNRTFVVPSSQSGLHSPFSVSSSAVYHHQQHHHHQKPGNTHHKLLSPTRFSTNNLTSSNVSWLSGGYFNQRRSMAEIPRTGLIIPTAQTQTLTPMEECLSRSSSHSSGFESQNGRLNGNMSRENSLCPDFSLDYHQRTLTTDNINSFQPIDSPNLGLFSPRPSLLSNPSLNNFPLEHSDIWKQPTFTRRSNNGNTIFTKNSLDSFNLRKINEELPSIKRGDLLQKWKESQTIS